MRWRLFSLIINNNGRDILLPPYIFFSPLRYISPPLFYMNPDLKISSTWPCTVVIVSLFFGHYSDPTLISFPRSSSKLWKLSSCKLFLNEQLIRVPTTADQLTVAYPPWWLHNSWMAPSLSASIHYSSQSQLMWPVINRVYLGKGAQLGLCLFSSVLRNRFINNFLSLMSYSFRKVGLKRLFTRW